MFPAVRRYGQISRQLTYARPKNDHFPRAAKAGRNGHPNFRDKNLDYDLSAIKRNKFSGFDQIRPRSVITHPLYTTTFRNAFTE